MSLADRLPIEFLAKVNRSSISRIAVALAGAISSGIMLYASFPNHSHSILAWFGLTPLLLVIIGRNPLSAATTALIGGMVFFLGVFTWIFVVPGYNALHHILLAVYLGSYLGIFGLLFAFVSRSLGGFLALIAAPFIWVTLEFVRSNLSFLALPWGLLAHSQYQAITLIQSASIAGVHGIAFIIVAVNCTLAALILLALNRLTKKQLAAIPKQTARQTAVLSGGTILFLVAILIFGRFEISKPIEGASLNLAVIQGNIGLAEKRDPANAERIMKIYSDLTRRASEFDPDLIVWPENATPGPITGNPKLFAQISQLGEKSDTHLLLGSSKLHKFNANQPQKAKYTNSAFLIAPTPGPLRVIKYDKIRLFPFGEYLPYKGRLPWSSIGVPAVDSYKSGTQYKVFYLDKHPFSVTICWENLFSELVRQFVKNGAQFIVNITNESWFGETAAPYQFLSMNVFRAVENRVYLIRCANTGISSFIDPHGRIIDRVKDKFGKDIFVSGFLTGRIVPLISNTFYTRYGNWFAWLCTFCTAIFVLLAVSKPKAP